jgi:hypothetical protein
MIKLLNIKESNPLKLDNSMGKGKEETAIKFLSYVELAMMIMNSK